MPRRSHAPPSAAALTAFHCTQQRGPIFDQALQVRSPEGHCNSGPVKLAYCAGGGYTKKNVARCWTYETAVLLGREEDVAEPIPPNRYISHQENIKLTALENKSGHPSFPNLNTREYLEKIKETVLENLRHLSHAPGVQFDDALPERLLEEYQFNVAEKQVLTDYAIDHRIMADHEAEQTPRFGPDRFL